MTRTRAMDDDNRRRQPRFLVEGIHGRMSFASQVEILNMSVSGVAIKVDRRLNIGVEHALKLEVHDKTVTVRGVIVWSVLSEIKKGKDGEDVPVYSAGLRFTDVLSQRLMELLEFIDAHKLVPEHRLGGVRFHIEAPGKALLDFPEAYQVKVISLSGMLIETDHPLETERQCPMEIAIDGGAPLRFAGRVASCLEVAEGPRTRYQIGIEFHDMPAPDRVRLGEFIHSIGTP